MTLDGANVPAELRRLLWQTYTERGVLQWWNGRNAMLGGYQPCELWKTPSNRNRVLGAAQAANDGNFT